jgi:hypothetical protein
VPRRGDHHRVAERARQAGLAPGGQRVAADVNQYDLGAPEPLAGGGDPGRGRRGPCGEVDQDGRPAEVLRGAGLGEPDAIGGAASGPAERSPGLADPLDPSELLEPARARMRIDGESLPGDAAQLEPVRAAERAGDRERSGDVAAAPDPDYE